MLFLLCLWACFTLLFPNYKMAMFYKAVFLLDYWDLCSILAYTLIEVNNFVLFDKDKKRSNLHLVYLDTQ